MLHEHIDGISRHTTHVLIAYWNPPFQHSRFDTANNNKSSFSKTTDYWYNAMICLNDVYFLSFERSELDGK